MGWFLFGLLFGFVAGFVFAALAMTRADRSAADDGFIKIDGTIYKLEKVDI